jgi:DNA-binding PadR family transcriptional regulator
MPRIMARHLYGTVDLLILKIVSSHGPLHGLAILDEIRRQSDDYLQVEDAALYPALHRLQKEKRRRAKFYDLTPAGRKELARAVEAWKNHAGAVCKVLEISWGDEG